MRIEVQEAIAELREQGKKVTRFSILGYSLGQSESIPSAAIARSSISHCSLTLTGGLVARYLVTMLSPDLVSNKIELVNFITIASPAVGLPPYVSCSAVVSPSHKFAAELDTPYSALSAARSLVLSAQSFFQGLAASFMLKTPGPTPANVCWRT